MLISCSSNETKKSQVKGDIQYTIGTQNLVKGRYTKALRALIEANKLKPNDSEILNNLGMAYYFKGDKKSAVKYLSESVQIDADNMDAKNNIASIYFESKKFNKAKVMYTEILKTLTYSRQYRTHMNLGLIAEKQGRQKLALDHYKKAINENVNFCPAYLLKGKIEVKLGYLDDAVKTFKEGSKGSCYEIAETSYQLAETFYKLKQYNAALTKYEEITSRFTKSQFSALSLMKINEIKKMRYNEQYYGKKEFDTSALRKKLLNSPQF